MKKFACAAVGMAGLLVLGGCGHSDGANNKAERDDVEMPAEESVSAIPDNAPVADPSANATDSAAAASSDGSKPAAGAVDKAAAAAEKKM